MQGRKPFPFLACGLPYTFIRAAGIVKRNCAVFHKSRVLHYCGQKGKILHFCRNRCGAAGAFGMNFKYINLLRAAFKTAWILLPRNKTIPV
jgi:hypothetical protein